MKALLQRVNHARVDVAGVTVGEIGEGLIRGHDVQIDVRSDVETPGHLIEQAAVLARHADDRRNATGPVSRGFL